MNLFPGSTVKREKKRHALRRSPFQSIVNAGNHIKKGPLWFSVSAAMNGITAAVKRSPKKICVEIFLFVAAVVYVHPKDFNVHCQTWLSSTDTDQLSEL